MQRHVTSRDPTYDPAPTCDPTRDRLQVAHAAEAHPDWYVAPSAGQGVFAVEECLERLLARVRAEKAGEGAQPVGA